MSMGAEGLVIFAYAIGIMLLYLIAYIILVPLKAIFKLLLNSFLGGVGLFLINYFGATFSINIPINIFTAFVTGVLGIPGVVLMFIVDKLYI